MADNPIVDIDPGLPEGQEIAETSRSYLDRTRKLREVYRSTQLHSHDIHSQRQQTETEQTLKPQFPASPTDVVALPSWGFPNDAIFCAQRFVSGSPIAAL